MTEKVGQIEFDVSFNTGRLLVDVRVVNEQLQRVVNEGEKLPSKFTKIAAAVSAAIASISVASLVTKVITAQRQFDVMFASLKTMTGSADAAGVAFEKLRKFADKTPYTLDQSVKGFVKLKALGLDPSERAMMSFGNTSSAMGKDLMQMIEAVADASTGEFERLKEFGIKAKVEGDKVSLTFQGVTTKIANNARSITEYLVKIGETEFAGAMAERMNTLDGNISNLEDSLAALYLSISQSGFGDAIAAGVRKATEVISEMTASIKQGGLTEYFDGLKPYINAAELALTSLAAVIAGRLVAAFVAAAAQAYATATAIGVATVAARGFGAVVAMLGGPIGIAITGLALLALNWEKVAGEARDAATMSEDAAARIAAALKKAPAQATRELGVQMGEVRGELAAIDKELGRTSFPKADPNQLKELQERRATLAKIADDIQRGMYSVGAGGGRGSTNPESAKPTPKADTSGVKGTKFDSKAYLAGLSAAAASEWDKVAIVEAEAVRKAGEHLKKKEINEQEHAQAITLIRNDAAAARSSIMDKELKDAIAEGERRFEAEKAANEKIAEGRRLANEALTEGDEPARLQMQLEVRTSMLLEAAARDMENAKLYADAKVALENETAKRIAEIKQREIDEQRARDAMSVGMASSAADSLYQVMEKAGKEKTALGKALFLSSKALAIAEIIMNTEAAATKAMGQLGIYGIPMSAMIRAQGYASAAVVAATAITSGGGRAAGGPVVGGSMYRVGERGTEIFAGASGRNYMIPAESGRVISNDQMGGGAATTVINIHNNHPTAQVSQRKNTKGDLDVFIAEAASQIAENRGPIWNAMRASTNVRPGGLG